jgi:hypothetical protein
MNDLFNSLDSGEVISIQQDAQVLVGHRIFRVSELNEAIANYLKTSVGNWTEEKDDWFTTQGINCEALRFGSTAWQKGRIRLCLEFCPDEVSPATSKQVTSTPVVVPPAQAAPVAAPVAAPIAAPVTTQSIAGITPVVTPVAAPPTSPSITANTTNTVAATNIPVAGIAAVGAGAAVMAATAAATIESAQIPNPAKVVAPVAPATPIPAISDVVLEADDKPAANGREGLDEIAFDFDVSNDTLGTMVPNGMMELDLTDLDLDRAENDYLDFENSALADPALELNPIHSIDKSENSGMLIDEVWNEMSQPNWPGIH